MAMRTASFGMYDLPQLRDANDALWSGLAGWLRRHGLDRVPDQLDRDRSLGEVWDDPDLLLAQTCGLPFATRWRDRLRYVATPCYTALGCEGPSYRSAIVVAVDDLAADLQDLRDRIVAINETSSNSGCNLLRQAVAPLSAGGRFFAGGLLTGSHLASMQAVAGGTAALAAIDVVTYAHIGRHLPGLAAQVRTIGWTPGSPGLPFVTSVATSDREIGLLRQALTWATASEELRGARDALLLQGLAEVPLAAYLAIAADGDDVAADVFGTLRAGGPV